jgi:hypothetical protein
MNPDLAAPAAVVLEKATQNAGSYGLLFSWVAVNVVVLAVFLSGAYALFKDTSPLYANLVLVGGALLSVFFPLSNLPLIGIVASGSGLASDSAMVGLLWQMHLAGFAFAELSLSTALFALSRCAANTNLLPGWLCSLGAVGAVLLIGAAVPILTVAQGSPITFVGLIGFLIWLVFLGSLGASMFRTAD